MERAARGTGRLFEDGVKGPRRRRSIAWVAASFAALALTAAAAIWFYRDLPRRRVEQVLARRLGAEVRLGAFAIEGTRSFILRDLVIRRMASHPRLDDMVYEPVVIIALDEQG